MLTLLRNEVINAIGKAYTTYACLTEDDENVYVVFRGENSYVYLMKLNKGTFTYQIQQIGYRENVNHPILNYDDNYLVVAGVSYGYGKLILHVIRKSDLAIMRTMQMNINFGNNYTAPSFIEKRSDGGITIIIYSKDYSNYSVRNQYVYNFAPMDILNDDLNLQSSFHLGAAGSFNKLKDGRILYHPEVVNATCNESDFRFLLYANEDFSSLKYGDGTNATEPFNCKTCDYSKKNTNVRDWTIPPFANIVKNNKINVAGMNLNNDAVYEIHDTNLNILNEIHPFQGTFYYIGLDNALLYMDSNKNLNVYYIDTHTVISLNNLNIGDAIFLAYAYNENYVYLFMRDKDGNARYAILSTGVINNQNPPIKEIYPFWLKGV